MRLTDNTDGFHEPYRYAVVLPSTNDPVPAPTVFLICDLPTHFVLLASDVEMKSTN